MDVNAIQVAVRVRPLTSFESSRIPEDAGQDLFMGDGALACASPARPGFASAAGGGVGGGWREVVDVVDHRTLIFDKPDTNASRAFINGSSGGERKLPGARKYKDQRYAFDRVFDKHSTQEEVFEHTAKPLLTGVFEGYNATVFAYGATGCGKTHTVSGTKEDPGIIYRTMQELFTMIDDSASEYETHVTVSFLEIYNELIRDLLSDDFPVAPRGGLSLREDEKNRISVAGLSQRQPQSADEVLELVLLGNSRRSSSPTHANAQSSRSHAVLQISIGRRPKGGDTVDLDTETVSTAVSSATLSIIDLAGSERASATQNMGNRMKEGANINKSLLALGNCINALCVAATRGKIISAHIPYRDSKLTRLLKFSLGGNCRTVMIVCVSPCSVHLEDTGNTLKYANRAKNIVTKVSQNINGVERNITQYLTAIAEKDATIKLLEARLAERNGAQTASQQRRQNEGKAEMAQAKVEMKQKTSTYLPAMTEGAGCQALWDAAELRISAYRARIRTIDVTHPAAGSLPSELAAEKALLESMIQKEEKAYAGNSTIQSRLQVAAKQTSFMDALLRSMQERRFEKLEANDVESVRAEARLQKADANVALAGAKEKAYRATISQQAESLSSVAGALSRCTASLEGGAGRLRRAVEDGDHDELVRIAQKIAKGMTDVATVNAGCLQSLLGSSPVTTSDLPAISSQPVRPYTLPPSTVPALLSSAMKPQRMIRRPSVAGPQRPSSAVEASFSMPKPSPAVRKILGPARPQGGPVRRQSMSPRKRSATAAQVARAEAAASASKKTLRWRDEAGQGDIDDHDARGRLSSPGSGVSSDEVVISTEESAEGDADDGDGVWEDDAAGGSEAADRIAPLPVPLAKSTLAPPPVVPHAGPRLNMDWKQSRSMNGKALGRLGTLGEERDASSPESAPKRLSTMGPPSLAHLGPPQRFKPPTQPLQSSGLGNLPPAGNTSGNNAFSLFAKPTSTYTGPPKSTTTNTRPFSLFGGTTTLPPMPENATASSSRPSISSTRTLTSPDVSDPKPSRRLSTIGPVRSERKRSRTSMLPSLAEDGKSSGLANGGSPRSASHSRMMFASPVKTFSGFTKGKSPRKSAVRRMSSLGTGAIRPPGPRASVSGAMTSSFGQARLSGGNRVTSPAAADPASARSVSAGNFANVTASSTAKLSPTAQTFATRPVPASLRRMTSNASMNGGEGGGVAKAVWK